VLDVTVTPPRLLRPGLVTPADIESLIGPVQKPVAPASAPAGEPARSPGMLARHYAPRTPMECIGDDSRGRIQEWLRQSLRVGWLTFAGTEEKPRPGLVIEVLPRDPAGYASGLYAALHRLDEAELDRILVTLPPHTEDWLAVHDRLRRACHG
jgi:L-threonylcarbamoyladenylate synthase